MINKSKSQQNFFNVPSSDITPKKKVFFQQQFNIYNQGLQLNSTLDIGLGNNYEIGLNVLGVAIEKIKNGDFILPKNISSKPYFPFLSLNAQKRIDLNQKTAISIGCQIGSTPMSLKRNGNYLYSNFIYRETKLGLKFVGGIYAASPSYFGEGTRFSGSSKIGIQSGIEKSFLKDRLLLQGDFISGKHNFGEVVIGGAYCITQTFILSAGYQIPTFHSKSEASTVIEITYCPTK